MNPCYVGRISLDSVWPEVGVQLGSRGGLVFLCASGFSWSGSVRDVFACLSLLFGDDSLRLSWGESKAEESALGLGSLRWPIFADRERLLTFQWLEGV